jgi:RecB family endonuclease NucS
VNTSAIADIARRRARKHAGVVIGVGVDGESWTMGLGRVGPDRPQPPAANTIFEIGSITKVFTATLLAQMAEEGLVALDDPVQRYLQDDVLLPVRGRPITLVDLATQSSGLPRLPKGLLRRALRESKNPYASFTVADLERAIPETKPRREPGRKLRYSNYGFGLLGQSRPRRCTRRAAATCPGTRSVDMSRDQVGGHVRGGRYGRPVRLIVARCEVLYTGRLNAVLPASVRLVMIKEDGSVLVHADAGSYKPLNWMTPPTVIEQEGTCLIVRKRAGRTEDRLEIHLLEVVSDMTHEMGEAAELEKDGVERDLQELLAAQPSELGEELRLVRREWPTDIGPVDLMCRDADDQWVAVEVKRVATLEAVEQLSRYLERIRLDPAMASCRGILAAQRFTRQAATLADARGLYWVEVDLETLRGTREPELTLFSG